MTYKELDFFFPFIVFGYGAIMTIVLNSAPLMELAERRFPKDLVQQMNMHRYLAIVCLVIGAMWTLQNIWFGSAQFL